MIGPFGDDEEDADVVDGQVIGTTSSPDVGQSSSSSAQSAGPVPPPQVFTKEQAEAAAAGRGVIVLKVDANAWPPSGDGPAAPAYTDITDEFLNVAMNQRSRAYALFLEVPFFAYIALNRNMPGLVRVGAAVLGVMRALEVTERQAEFEQYLSEIGV